MISLDTARGCSFCHGTALVSPGGLTRPCPRCQRQHYPPRVARPVARLALLALALLAGCSAALGTTPATKAALVVVDVATLVRRYVCARELDPLLGDPRAHPPAADAGSLADVGGAE